MIFRTLLAQKSIFQNEKNRKNRLADTIAFSFHFICLLLFTAHIQFGSASTAGSFTNTNLSNDIPPPPPPPPTSSQFSTSKQNDILNTFQRPPPPPPISSSLHGDDSSKQHTKGSIQARNHQQYENVNSDSNSNTFSSNVTPPPPPPPPSPPSHNQGQNQNQNLQNYQNNQPPFHKNQDPFRSGQNQEYPRNHHQPHQYSAQHHTQYQPQSHFPSHRRHPPPYRPPPPTSGNSGKLRGRTSIFNQLAVKSKQDFSSILQKVHIVKKKIVPPFPMSSSQNDKDTPMQRKIIPESSSSIPQQHQTLKTQPIRPSPASASSPQNSRSDSNWYTQTYDMKNSNNNRYGSSGSTSTTSFLDDIKASISLDTYNTDDHLSDSDDSDGDFDHHSDTDNDNAIHDETNDYESNDLKGSQNYDNDTYKKFTGDSSITMSNASHPIMSTSMKQPYEYTKSQPNNHNHSFQPPPSQLRPPPASSSSSIQPPNRNPLPSMSNTGSPYSSTSSLPKTQSKDQSPSSPFQTPMNQVQTSKVRPYSPHMGPNPHRPSRPYRDNNYDKYSSSSKSISKKIGNSFQIILAPFSRVSRTLIPSTFFSKLFNLKNDDSHAYLSMKNTASLLRDNGWDDDDDDDDDTNSNNQVPSTLNNFDSNKGRRGYFNRNRPGQNIPSSSAKTSTSIIPLQVTRLLQGKPNQKATSTYSSIGRNLALLDAISLGFFLLFLNDDHDSWGIYALPCSILTIFTSHVLYRNKIQRLAKEKAIEAWDDSKYVQLWNQLVSGVTLDPKMPSTMAKSAYLKVKSSIALKRLSSYVNILTMSILIIYVSKDKVFVRGLGQTLWEIVNMHSLKTWPIIWANVWAELKFFTIPWFERVREMTTRAINFSIEHPLYILGKLSLLLALWFTALLPQLEKWWVENHKRKNSLVHRQTNVNVSERLMDSNTLSTLGRSSCSRLQITAPAIVRGLLERWKMMQTSPIGAHESNASTLESSITSIDSKTSSVSLSTFSIKLRSMAYNLLVLLVFSVPIFFAGTSSIAITYDDKGPNLSKNLLQRVAILIQTFVLAKNTLLHFMSFSHTDILTRPYRSQLAPNISQSISGKKGSELELKAMIAPTKGIIVTDLWAAHNSKRAWATQGVSFQSRAGEVVLILGENSMGKTRLLASIAEIIFAPPKSAKSTTLVRGAVSVVGIDLVQQSGFRSHRDRVGVLLNDVRSIADISGALSGCTLEEILEPNSSLGTSFVFGAGDTSPASVTKQKDAIKIALQITGISSRIEELPSKLATVITAYEDELTQAPDRPQSVVLSPSEWEKVLLSKIIARTIAQNANPYPHYAQKVNPNNCMVGSVLVLDDALSLSNEVEEVNIINSLKKSGAATVLSSRRWALGRFADRIIVLKDGKVLESGTHAELLGMGPQGSLYAAKWDVMTAS